MQYKRDHQKSVRSLKLFDLYDNRSDGQGKQKSIDSALQLCQNSLEFIRMFKTKESGYLSKFEALFMVMKAYIHALMGNDDLMESDLKEGKRLALSYDMSRSNNIAKT